MSSESKELSTKLIIFFCVIHTYVENVLKFFDRIMSLGEVKELAKQVPL